MTSNLKSVQAVEKKHGRLFYVYALRDPRNEKIFYVGQTNQPEERPRRGSQYSPATRAYLEEMRSFGCQPVCTFFGAFANRTDAVFQENFAIESLRAKGIKLTNMLSVSKVDWGESIERPQTEQTSDIEQQECEDYYNPDSRAYDRLLNSYRKGRTFGNAKERRAWIWDNLR